MLEHFYFNYRAWQELKTKLELIKRYVMDYCWNLNQLKMHSENMTIGMTY